MPGWIEASKRAKASMEIRDFKGRGKFGGDSERPDNKNWKFKISRKKENSAAREIF